MTGPFLSCQTRAPVCRYPAPSAIRYLPPDFLNDSFKFSPSTMSHSARVAPFFKTPRSDDSFCLLGGRPSIDSIFRLSSMTVMVVERSGTSSVWPLNLNSERLASCGTETLTLIAVFVLNVPLPRAGLTGWGIECSNRGKGSTG